MTNLTIQLSLDFDFDFTEAGLSDAIELLDYIVRLGLAVSSLRVYNEVFEAIHLGRKNGTLSLPVFSELQARLVSCHFDVLALNGVR